jgi:hypothetical protein
MTISEILRLLLGASLLRSSLRNDSTLQDLYVFTQELHDFFRVDLRLDQIYSERHVCVTAMIQLGLLAASLYC